LTSITILTSLTKIMNSIDTEHTKLDQRLQLKPNQKLTETVQDLQNKKKRLDRLINDLFDGVFVHRYRDSDPLIRADCIQSFGNWIISYPDLFLEPQYLKYLGWMLSDKVYYY
jgi:cohesin complex subunit SA-1/2